ncbi:MAG: hypothetical protein R2796_05835 [Chitinophagaceae bacterium]|nr:hypothetical protein [Chitinophagaceae bacterium]MCB0741503.1 hypothetical protein [Chitinophagaceae bacterium]HQV06779.1 hypothetical protein [Chitinophagaceae bacterium]
MKCIIFLMFLGGSSIMSFAQPFTLDENIKPVQLEFHKYEPPDNPKAKGRINITQVTQVKDTQYFFCSGASIYSPVYVGVTTDDKEHPLDVQLAKMNWKNPDRKGSTGSSGHWEDKFKTENDFGIMVIAKNKPAKYALIVWNGDEVKFDLPSVFSNDKASAKKSGGGFLKKNGLYIVIGLLVVIVGLLAFKLKNKKS